MSGYRALRIGELLVGTGRRPRVHGASADGPRLPAGAPGGPPARRDALRRTRSPRARVAASRPGTPSWIRTGSSRPSTRRSWRRLAEHSLSPVCGNAWRILAGVDLTHPVFQYPGNLVGRLTPSLIERWELGDDGLFEGLTTWAEVVDEVAGRRDDRPSEPLRARIAAMDVGSRAPARTHPRLRAPSRTRRGSSTPGRSGSAATPTPSSRRRRCPGSRSRPASPRPSWRQVIDVGKWDASGGIHVPGQSGQPGSRHYRDLSRRWKTNRQFPLYWSAPEVRRHARDAPDLSPAPAAHGARRPAGEHRRRDPLRRARDRARLLPRPAPAPRPRRWLARSSPIEPSPPRTSGLRPPGRRTGAPRPASPSRSAGRWRRSSIVGRHGVVVLSEQDLTVLAVANNPHPDQYREIEVRGAVRSRRRLRADLRGPVHADGGGAHQPLACSPGPNGPVIAAQVPEVDIGMLGLPGFAGSGLVTRSTRRSRSTGSSRCDPRLSPLRADIECVAVVPGGVAVGVHRPAGRRRPASCGGP